jgi:predicted enzyme related to lactoylglutathione lyase
MQMEGAMLGYVTVGANDFEKAKAFYDRVFAGQRPRSSRR